MPRPFLLLLLALPILACQGLQQVTIVEVTRTPAPAEVREGSAAESEAVEAGPPPDTGVPRVAYIGADRNLYVADPVSGNRLALTDDARGFSADRDAQFYRYPTWSPDSRYIAYVSISQSGRRANGTLFATAADGSDRLRLFSSDEQIPFYLYWSPDSRRLSFLSPQRAGSSELALQVTPLAAGETAIVDSGQPYYWQWSPDGERLFTHVGGSEGRLAFLDLAAPGNATRLSLQPLAFQAPAWSPDGRHILLAASDGDTVGLLLTDPQGSFERLLTTVDNPVAFGWSPDGEHIALIEGASPTQGALGSLRVLDSKAPESPLYIDDALVISFFWSPDGQYLAYFALTDSPANLERETGKADGRLLRPALQTGGLFLEVRLLHMPSGDADLIFTFRPTQDFLSLLPFFDQYQHSARLWSPDSTQLVVAAEEDEQPTLWLVSVAGATPRILDTGHVAFFSWE